MKRLLLLGWLSVPGSLLGQDSLRVAQFPEGDWLRADRTLEIRLSRPVGLQEGRLAVFIGVADVTPLFRASGDRLVHERGAIGLPQGQTEVAVYLVSPTGSWQEIGRAPVRILTRGGLQEARVTPRLTIESKGQLAEGHGTAPPPTRDQFQDLSLNGGFQTSHTGGGWSVTSQANLVGVSNRLEALRYAERQEQAPRVDLADYLVALGTGPVRFSFGHQSVGANRHLINGFASRGLGAALKFGPAELGLAMLNGSSAVGWSNPFGIGRSDHRITAGTIGLEAAPSRPGLLRVELSAVDGSVLPQAGYTQGVVNDAETSRGAGVRVAASDPSQRVRLEAGFTRGRFHNPQDTALSQGASLVPVRPTTRNAQYLEASVEVIRGFQLGKSLPVGFTTTLRHERVDPLFRGVAATPQADLLQQEVGVTGSIGELAIQGGIGRSHDNLDRIESILTTRSRTGSLNLALPVGFVVGKIASWLPMMTYTFGRMHQYGTGVPVNSGFSESHVPDQVSTTHALGGVWQGATWHASYQAGRSFQDNRETGRENADFGTWTHQFAAAVTPLRPLDLGIELGLEKGDNREIPQRIDTRRIGGTVAWRIRNGSSISGSASTTRTTDDLATLPQHFTELRLEVSQRVRLVRFAASRMAGQVFLRFARQSGTMTGTGVRTWSLNSGASLTVF